MKIELQPPYSNDWQRGYILINREGRKIVCLYKYESGKEIRKTTAYARYLMSVKLGRYLTADEEVDHIDEHKTNDTIDNLQILSGTANKLKYHASLPPCPINHGYNGYKRKGCRCPICVATYREMNKKYNQAYRARKRMKACTQ